EQHLGVHVLGAVGGQQVVQVDRERSAAEAAAVGAGRRQPFVAAPGVRRHLVEEQVELVRLVGSGGHAVGRERGDREAPDRREVVVQQPVVEQVLQRGGDAGDGKRAA